MSSIETDSPAKSRQLKERRRQLEQKQAIAAEYDQYRSISVGAVLTIAFAGLATLTVLMSHSHPVLLVVPLIGTFIGTYTVFSLRRRTDQYVGIGYARIGLVVSLLSLCVGTSLAAYTYATEVPEGYERISFSDLQPIPTHKDIPFSPVAAELSERKVFVKGYVYPDGQLNDIKRFVLVPDMGTCCFGGQPKLTDMIQVTLEDPLRTKYSYTRRSFAGTFRLGADSAHQVGNVIYHLDADYAK